MKPDNADEKSTWINAQEFDPATLEVPAADVEPPLSQPAQLLDPHQVHRVADSQEAQHAATNHDDIPVRSRWGRVLGAAVATLLGTAVVAECYRLSSWGFDLHWLLGMVLSTAMLTTAVAVGGYCLIGLRGLRQLDQRASSRQQGQELLHSRERGEAVRVLDTVARQLQGSVLEAPLQRAISDVDSVYSDGEIIRFVSNHGFQQADQQVLERVSRHSLETAVMVGVSPFVAFDMLLIGWRNWKMLNEVAGLYGVAPGKATQWRLLRQVLHNLAFVGLSELTIDGGGALLGSSLTSQLSARMGQGLGAGLMTARVGLQAARLCRPLPYADGKQPRLGHIQERILGQLKDSL